MALPFLLLPSPFTIEASDVYGGFGLHIAAAVLLAVVGAVWGAARAHFLAGGGQGDGPARRLLALLVGAAVLGLYVCAAAGLGERLAAELLAGAGEDGTAPATLVLRAAAFAVLVRLASDRREGPLVLATASVGLGTLLGAALLAGAVGPTGLSGSFEGVGLLLAGLAVLAPLAGARLPVVLGGVGIAGATACLGGLAAVLLGGAVAPSIVGDPIVPVAVALDAARRTLAVNGLIPGLFLGAGITLALAEVRVPIREHLGRPFVVLGHLLLGLLLVTAGSLLHDTAGITATLWAFPTGLIPWGQLIAPPEPAELGVVVAVVVGGLLASSTEKIHRWLGGVGLTWLLAVAVQTFALQNPEWGRTAWILPSAAGLLLALAWPRLLERRTAGRDLGRHLRWGYAAVGLATGPVVFRFAAASLLSWAPPPTLVALGGGAAGLAFGLLAARLPTEGRLSIDLRIGAVLLVGVAVLLPFYVAVFIGLFPLFALLTAAGLVVGATVLCRWTSIPAARPWACALVVPWLMFYVAFAAVTDYRRGPDEADCRRVLDRTEAEVLIDRFSLPDDQQRALPYDVLPLSDPDVVLASFKRIDIDHGGFLLTFDRAQPEQRHALTTYREDGPLWPERIVQDPGSGSILVQVLGVGAYALWEILVSSGPEASVGRIVPLDWEPSNPGVDTARGRLVLGYVPNRGSSNPLLDVVDLADMRIEDHHHSDPRGVQMSDWATVDPTSGNYWIAALVGPLSFVLTEVGGEDLRPRRRLETYFPTVGMEIDRAQRRILATNVIGGDLVAIDLDTLQIRQRISAGAFPRDVAIDRERGRIYVAGYGDGRVHRFAIDGRVIESLGAVEVGPLLRGIGLDPASGRVLAASGCGIFELPPK